MRRRIDLLYLLTFAYPLAVLVGFWLWPDVTGMFLLVGAVIGVPLFLLQDRGEQPIEGRGSSWFQVILVGVSLAWPFIIFTLLRLLKRRGAGVRGRDERDPDADG